MKKEIVFTTLEEQGNSLKKYSRSLTPMQRLEYLYLLNCQAYDMSNVKKLSESDVVHIFMKKETESLEEFLRNRKKRAQA